MGGLDMELQTRIQSFHSYSESSKIVVVEKHSNKRIEHVPSSSLQLGRTLSKLESSSSRFILNASETTQ